MLSSWTASIPIISALTLADADHSATSNDTPVASPSPLAEALNKVSSWSLRNWAVGAGNTEVTRSNIASRSAGSPIKP